MDVRVATDDDADRIVELERAVGCLVELDMTAAASFWMVTEVNGVVEAAAQVLIGLPISSIELLAVNPALSPHLRARIVREMLTQGFEGLAGKGAQYVTATIPFKYKSYRRALEKRGCRVMDQGSVMVKQLR